MKVYRLVSKGTIEELMYMRQVYKQHFHEGTLSSVQHMRLFHGVQGVKGEEGELFGIDNLLKYDEEGFFQAIVADHKKMSEELLDEHKDVVTSSARPPDTDGAALRGGAGKRTAKRGARRALNEDEQHMIDVAGDLLEDGAVVAAPKAETAAAAAHIDAAGAADDADDVEDADVVGAVEAVDAAGSAGDAAAAGAGAAAHSDMASSMSASQGIELVRGCALRRRTTRHW